jgi:hypothetical protein
MHLKDIGFEGLDSYGSGQDLAVDSCENIKEPLGFIKCREFLDSLCEYQLLKKILPHGVSIILLLNELCFWTLSIVWCLKKFSKLVIDYCVNSVDVCIVIFCLYF